MAPVTITSAADVEKYWENLQASAAREQAVEDEESISQVLKTWVVVTGLQSEAGKKLKGCLGKLLKDTTNEDGRLPVIVEGHGGAGKLLKESNIQRLTRDDLCQTYLLPDHKIQFWPKMHSMFKCRGNSPALAMCGCPIVVKRLDDGSSMDNQWAT